MVQYYYKNSKYKVTHVMAFEEGLVEVFGPMYQVVDADQAVRYAQERLISNSSDLNRQIVALGTDAVREEVVTKDNLVAETLTTVDRHVSLIQAIGASVIVDTREPAPGGFVASSRISMGEGLEVELRQSIATGLDSNEFMREYDNKGLASALTAHASPLTTQIAGFKGGTVPPGLVVPLALSEFGDRDRVFYTTWRQAAYALGTLPGTQSRRQRIETQGSQGLGKGFSPEDLIFSAGLVVRFKRLLDGIETRLG